MRNANLSASAWLLLFAPIAYVVNAGYLAGNTASGSWQEAEEYCQTTHGTHLASISSQHEYLEALTTCYDASTANDPSCFIGLNDMAAEGVYTWVDGTELSFGFDAAGDPLTGQYPWNTVGGVAEPNNCYIDSRSFCSPCCSSCCPEQCSQIYRAQLGWNDKDCSFSEGHALCNNVSAASATSTDRYFVSDTTMNWADAQAYCEAQGSSLASIHSYDESVTAANACSSRVHCWIGLHRSASNSEVWQWSDNSALDFGFTATGTPIESWYQWRDGEPNNWANNEGCGEYWIPAALNDVSCEWRSYPLCNGPTPTPTSAAPTTAEPTTAEPTTAEPTTADPTTTAPTTTVAPTMTTTLTTTAKPATIAPTSAELLTKTPTAVVMPSAPHRNYTNYTVTIQIDDMNVTDTNVLLIVRNASFTLSSTPLFVVISAAGANEDDRTTELVIAFPSNVELVTDVIASTVREAIVKEYPETEDRVHVTVEKNMDIQTQSEKAKKFSDGALIALVVFFVVFAAFLVVYVWKTRRGDKKGVAQEQIQIGKVQRTNRGNDEQPGQQPDLIRVYSDDENPDLQASPGRAVNGNTVDFASQSSLGEIGDQNANDNEVISATPDGVTAGGVTENIVNVPLEDGEFVVDEDGEGSENETTGGNGQ